MLQGLWKPLLILILVENVILNEGKNSEDVNIDSPPYENNLDVRNKKGNIQDSSNTWNNYQYHPHFAKKRKCYSGRYRPEKRQATQMNVKLLKSPNNYEVYVLGPNEVDEKTIRGIIDAKKIDVIPQCSKLQYETVEKWGYLQKRNGEEVGEIPRTVQIKQANQKRQSQIPDYVQKIRAKWRLRLHEPSPNYKLYTLYKKSPLEQLHLQQDERRYNKNLEHEVPFKNNNVNLESNKGRNEAPVVSQNQLLSGGREMKAGIQNTPPLIALSDSSVVEKNARNSIETSDGDIRISPNENIFYKGKQQSPLERTMSDISNYKENEKTWDFSVNNKMSDSKNQIQINTVPNSERAMEYKSNTRKNEVIAIEQLKTDNQLAKMVNNNQNILLKPSPQQEIMNITMQNIPVGGTNKSPDGTNLTNNVYENIQNHPPLITLSNSSTIENNDRNSIVTSEGNVKIDLHENILYENKQKSDLVQKIPQTSNNKETEDRQDFSSNQEMTDNKNQIQISTMTDSYRSLEYKPAITKNEGVTNEQFKTNNQIVKVGTNDQNIHSNKNPQQQATALTERNNTGGDVIQPPAGTNTIEIVHKNIQSIPNVNESLESNQGNVSYVYIQNTPLSNALISQSILSQNASIDNPEQNLWKMSDETISISISPKNLENKVLPSALFKKSGENKKSDILNSKLLADENSSEIHTNVIAPQSHEKLTLLTPISNEIIKIIQGPGAKQESKNSSEASINSEMPKLTHVLQKAENYRGSMPLNSKPQIFTSSNTKGNSKFRRSIRSLKGINSGKQKGFDIRKNGGTIINADEITQALISQIKDDNEKNDDKMSALTNGLTKVIVIQTKQKDACPSEFGCEQTPRDVHCSDSKCSKTTQCLENFKELNEGYREDDLDEFNDLYKENPKWKKECSVLPLPVLYNCPNTKNTAITPCPSQNAHNIKLEGKSKELETALVNQNTKGLNNGKREYEFPINEEIVNFIDESQLNFEKGNKKIENKILEGFISSIIANYTKDEGKASTHEPVENSKEKTGDSESVASLIKDFANKQNVEGSVKSNLVSVIIPESTLSKYTDNTGYSKLGPFNEAEIKSLLKKGSIQLVQK